MKIAILTGAGISRESGLATFRDADGLWAGYKIEEVCTPEALANDPQKVLDFYNLRRQEVLGVEPNAAHFALSELEKDHEVTIITQNIDDLHERGGSTNIIHVHGEIFKVRSLTDFECVVESNQDVNLGDLATDGQQLRPHVCFFGETPYQWNEAVEAVLDCDLFTVIGTSLQVYPAAGLVDMARGKQIVLIDPNPTRFDFGVTAIAQPATIGVPDWVNSLITKDLG